MYYDKTMRNRFSELLLQSSKLIQHSLMGDSLLDYNLRVLAKLSLSGTILCYAAVFIKFTYHAQIMPKNKSLLSLFIYKFV